MNGKSQPVGERASERASERVPVRFISVRYMRYMYLTGKGVCGELALSCTARVRYLVGARVWWVSAALYDTPSAFMRWWSLHGNTRGYHEPYLPGRILYMTYVHTVCTECVSERETLARSLRQGCEGYPSSRLQTCPTSGDRPLLQSAALNDEQASSHPFTTSHCLTHP